MPQPAVTQQEPALALDPSMYSSVAEYTGKYIVVMVDPDAPSPDNPTSRFILHWLAADVEQNATATSPQTGRALSVPQTAAVPYRAPGPPPTSSAHRYILYAFAQPSNFTMPAAFRAFNNTNRAGFQLDQFITAAGLARPMAGEYFYVSRQSAVPGDFMAAAGGEFPGGNGNAVFAGKGSSSGNQTSTTPVTAAAPPHMPGVEFAVSLFAISMLGFFLFA